MNKTTIYRVLDKLEDDGILHSFLDKNGVKWYAKCNGCSKAEHVDIHPHFECIDCGKIDCIDLDLTYQKYQVEKFLGLIF
jgi:Fur family ferric uptake transcriptional regulator